MNIIDVFLTLMMACNQVPDKCLIVEDVEQKIINIMICNENLTSSSLSFDFILFDKDRPEKSRNIIIDAKCTSL